MPRNPFRSLALAVVLALPLAPAAARADTWNVDGVHSSAIFKIKHLNVSHFYGRFNDISGKVVLDDAAPEKSSIEIEVKAESVDTNNPKRDQHLKSPDFFNVKQFPKIAFKSTSVKKTGENTFEVTGDLSLHGVTKAVTVTFTRTGSGKDPWGGTRAGGETTLKIKRSDFGMTFMLDGVGDDVELTISIEAVKA